MTEILRELQSDGILTLSPPKHVRFVDFITDVDSAWWVYSTVFVTLIEIGLVFYQPQQASLVTVRVILGLFLLGFSPGYSTMKVLLPSDPYPPLERILLSIFLSVVISIALGVILGVDYLFTGDSSVALIGGYTIVLALAAAFRRYSFLKT